MRKKGFTLVELLVVIAIIAMLLAILMPALAKVKTLAYQMLCGTNLKGVANAILVYSQDNSEKYPVAGVSGVTWNVANTTNPAAQLLANNGSWQWDDTSKPTSSNSKATVSACLYLLVKYADVSPSSFVCKANKQKKLNIQYSQSTNADTRERGGAIASGHVQGKDATECWDFSNAPSRYCSYAYSYPWTFGGVNYALSSSAKAGMAVAGDLNPWIDWKDDPTWNGGVGVSGTNYGVDAATPDYTSPQLIRAAKKETFVAGNSLAHDGTGQNILFNDAHVEFTKQPNPDSAIQNDNVYTPWDTTQLGNIAGRQRGIRPTSVAVDAPKNREDSFLVQW